MRGVLFGLLPYFPLYFIPLHIHPQKLLYKTNIIHYIHFMLSELEYLYRALQGRKAAYLLEHVVDETKDYSVADVHSWGKLEECRVAYQKLMDLQRVKMMAIAEENRDLRGLIEGALKAEYYVGGRVEDDGVRYELTEADRRMLARAGVSIEDGV